MRNQSVFHRFYICIMLVPNLAFLVNLVSTIVTLSISATFSTVIAHLCMYKQKVKWPCLKARTYQEYEKQYFVDMLPISSSSQLIVDFCLEYKNLTLPNPMYCFIIVYH